MFTCCLVGIAAHKENIRLLYTTSNRNEGNQILHHTWYTYLCVGYIRIHLNKMQGLNEVKESLNGTFTDCKFQRLVFCYCSLYKEHWIALSCVQLA